MKKKRRGLEIWVLTAYSALLFILNYCLFVKLQIQYVDFNFIYNLIWAVQLSLYPSKLYRYNSQPSLLNIHNLSYKCGQVNTCSISTLGAF